ncbi:Nitrogen assimilation transcription factor nit-4-like protein 9 [Botrytis cinerea]
MFLCPNTAGRESSSHPSPIQQPLGGSRLPITCSDTPLNPQGSVRPSSGYTHSSSSQRKDAGPKKYPFNAEVTKRLFQTYFDCIHPLWPILYKPMYTSFDYTYPSPTIPNVLACAMFAIAACVEKLQPVSQPFDDPHIMGSEEPRFYFEESLNLLQRSNDTSDKSLKNAFTPSIVNCQTLTILSLQQHGVAEYSRAAIFCGLASSMAIELRLHRPHEAHGPQCEIRYRLWWNLFILEKMISCEMGRPVMLRVEETDTPYPSTSEADEFELLPSRMKRQNTTNINVVGKMHTLSILVTTIQLSVTMERLSREVYGLMSRRAIRDDRSFDLSSDVTSVPGVVTNYVIMHSGVILLHRPFIARWISNPASTNASAHPLKICLNSANAICAILENCKHAFISIKATGWGDNAESQRRLKMCIHWLSVLGKGWNSAGARQQLLVDSMPRDVNMTTLVNAAAAVDAQESTSSQLLSEQELMYARHSTADTTPGTAKPGAAEDWEFLRGFGDSSDEFYILDEELRVLLESDQQWNL